jgi:hypothetical protein
MIIAIQDPEYLSFLRPACAPAVSGPARTSCAAHDAYVTLSGAMTTATHTPSHTSSRLSAACARSERRRAGDAVFCPPPPPPPPLPVRSGLAADASGEGASVSGVAEAPVVNAIGEPQRLQTSP